MCSDQLQLHSHGATVTTADYALIVSLASAAISLVALLWNVWQKYIYVKPNLQVAFGVYRVSHPGGYGHGRQLLNLTLTNMGPGPAILAVIPAGAVSFALKRATASKPPQNGQITPSGQRCASRYSRALCSSLKDRVGQV